MKNILLVDDSFTARKIIGLMLKERGYQIIEADNGIEALEKMAHFTIDLVITDLNMPKMDGLELISSLKNDLTFKDIPIIIISLESENQERERVINSGASAYFKKPVSKSKLIKKIDGLLS